MSRPEKTVVKRYSTVTERFCSKIGENAYIVTTRTEAGEELKCLSADKCSAPCVHRRDKEDN